MENFIRLHNEGYSIKEIAEISKVSVTTIYKNLDKIAEEAGVTRESLLKQPFEADHSGRNFTPVKPIDKTAFKEGHARLMVEIQLLRSEINKTIEEMGIMEELFGEE